MENKIDFIIPDELINSSLQKLNEVATDLKPYLIALTPAERQYIPKMSDKTLPFVEKTLDYCKTAPQFAPVFMNIGALTADMKVYNQLIPLLRIVQQLNDGLDDTTKQAGAESFVNSLNYYNAVKQAAKTDVPGAKSIFSDLQKRFARVKNKNEKNGTDAGQQANRTES